MTETYAKAGPEPTLAELFADPIMRAVMRRDRISDEAVCRAIAIGRFRLGLEAKVEDQPCRRSFWAPQLQSYPCGCIA